MSRLLESDEDEKVAPRIDPHIDPEIAAWLGEVGSHIGGSGGPDAASGAGIKVDEAPSKREKATSYARASAPSILTRPRVYDRPLYPSATVFNCFSNNLLALKSVNEAKPLPTSPE